LSGHLNYRTAPLLGEDWCSPRLSVPAV